MKQSNIENFGENSCTERKLKNYYDSGSVLTCDTRSKECVFSSSTVNKKYKYKSDISGCKQCVKDCRNIETDNNQYDNNQYDISTTQPSTTQPSTTQPSTTQPSTTQPSTTQPSTTQPSTHPDKNGYTWLWIILLIIFIIICCVAYYVLIYKKKTDLSTKINKSAKKSLYFCKNIENKLTNNCKKTNNQKIKQECNDKLELLKEYKAKENGIYKKVENLQSCKEYCPKKVENYLEPIAQNNSNCSGFSYLGGKELLTQREKIGRKIKDIKNLSNIYFNETKKKFKKNV